MSDIFSHAATPARPGEPLPPVVVQTTVAAEVEQAFSGWTEHIRLWWPVAEYSVSGAGAIVDFEAGELVETSEGDQMISWGTVESWEPPTSLVLSWHPGESALQATKLKVTFSPCEPEQGTPAGSDVKLTHTGWERLPNPETARAEYEERWPQVLDRFVRFMGGRA